MISNNISWLHKSCHGKGKRGLTLVSCQIQYNFISLNPSHTQQKLASRWGAHVGKHVAIKYIILCI